MIKRIDGSSYQHLYFACAAVTLLALVLTGFSKTYFLIGMLRAPLPSRLVQVHAVLFIGWILLLNLQIALVTNRKVHWHRRLGAVMIVWAIFMLAVGPPTVFAAVRRSNSGVSGLEFFGDLAQLVVFAVLVGNAILRRRDAAVHKRLMLLGSAALMLPALARMELPLPLFATLYLLVPISLVAWDASTLGRVRRETALGAGLVASLIPLSLVVASTPIWDHFTIWVRGH